MKMNKLSKTIFRIQFHNEPFISEYLKIKKNKMIQYEVSKYGSLFFEPFPNYVKEFSNELGRFDNVDIFNNEKEFSRIHIKYGMMDEF